MNLPQLRCVRWAVRAALILAVAASIAANVLHARHNPISQTIAAWPPLALLLNIELISRIPVHRRSLGITRMAATTAIAGIAAWVSYWHMAGVAARYGEQGSSPYLLPLSVDGLIIVASVSLVELAGRIRTAAQTEPSLPQPALGGHATFAWRPAQATTRASTPTGRSDTTTTPRTAEPAGTPSTNGHNRTGHNGNGHNGNGYKHNGDRPVAAPLKPLSAPAPAPTTGQAARPTPADVASDLAALLPAARAARDELQRQGRGLTRDSLARQLRRAGHTVRTARVSELLNLLKKDPPDAANGRDPDPNM